MQADTDKGTEEPGLENIPSESNKPVDKTFKLNALRSYWCLILMCLLYVSTTVLISPHGEFPIGDDFIYNGAVKDFLATGVLRLKWSAQACYLHILVGSLVCKLFGFSYCALRINNMFWTLFGTIGLWLALRTVGLGPLLSTSFAAVYLFNPIIYWLSFTFMTDAMSLGLTNWFFYLSLLGIRRKSLMNLTQGSLILMASLACRLFTAIYVVPALLANILSFRRGLSWCSVLALSLFGPLALVLGLPALFRLTEPVSAAVSLATMQLDISSFVMSVTHHTGQILWRIVVAVGQLSIYLGIFCSPIMLSLIFNQIAKNIQVPRVAWLSATFFLTVTVGTLVGHQEKLMPFNSNVLYPPFTCIPAIVGFPSSWYHEVWAMLTAISCLLGFSFIVVGTDYAWHTLSTFCAQLRSPSRIITGKRDIFILSCLLVSFGFVSLIIIAHDNDRYYSMVLAPALMAMALVWRKLKMDRKTPLIIFSIVALITVYSVASVHDCMSIYRARWEVINDLLKSGIDAKRIDGGWEFDLMNTPELVKTMHAIPGGWKIAEKDRGSDPLNKVRWWPVMSDEYVISQKEYPSYEVIKRYRYRNWVLRTGKEILALKKIKSADK